MHFNFDRYVRELPYRNFSECGDNGCCDDMDGSECGDDYGTAPEGNGCAGEQHFINPAMDMEADQCRFRNMKSAALMDEFNLCTGIIMNVLAMPQEAVSPEVKQVLLRHALQYVAQINPQLAADLARCRL